MAFFVGLLTRRDIDCKKFRGWRLAYVFRRVLLFNEITNRVCQIDRFSVKFEEGGGDVITKEWMINARTCQHCYDSDFWHTIFYQQQQLYSSLFFSQQWKYSVWKPFCGIWKQPFNGNFYCRNEVENEEKVVKLTWWCVVCHDNGVMEIYTLPDFSLVFLVKNFNMAPRVLVDSGSALAARYIYMTCTFIISMLIYN